MVDQISNISLSQIQRGPNDRTVFDSIDLQELIDSIQTYGLIQPITVRPMGEGYEIVAGERRFRAVQILHWDAIPCILKELNDEDASSIMLLENMARTDLNPMDEARAYHSRQDRFGWTVDRIAQVAGVSVRRVRKTLTLLNLADDIQALVASGQLSISYAIPMTELDPNRQHAAIRFLNTAGQISPVTFKAFIARLVEGQAQDTLFDLADIYAAKVKEHQVELQKRFVEVGQHAEALPPIRVDMKTDNTAKIMLRWTKTLREAGHTIEADAVGMLYNALIKSRWIYDPRVEEV